MEISKEELVKLYAQLVYTAKFLVRFRRGTLKTIGAEPKDYASEALLRHLEAPEKFIPEKGRTLISYLINHLLRQIISDEFRDRKRNQKANEFLRFKDRDELTDNLRLLDFFLDEEIDFEHLVEQVIAKLKAKGDLISVKIYDAKFINCLKTSEICTEFSLTSKEVNNAVGRIQRILDEVIAQNELDKSYGKQKI